MKRARYQDGRKRAGTRAGDQLRGGTGRAKDSPTEALAGAAPRSAERSGWLALVLVLGTVLAYLPVWHAGLIWDDRSFIMDNPLIRRSDGWWRFWFSTKPVDYYPVTSTLWWLEWRLWGDNPMGYHAVNVLLHGVAAVLLWRLLRRLAVPGAWLAAAIFAVHPVNVESVAWIAERKNVLAMVFYLGSLLCFVRSGWGWYALALVAFLLALLSKTAVAPMPFVLLGLVWWQRRQVKRADLLTVIPFFVLAVVIGVVSLWFQSHRAIGADVVRTDGFWARLVGAGWAISFYAYKALLPLGLRSIYPRWRIDVGAWWAYLPVLLVVGLFVVCWRNRRRWGEGPLWGLGYFVVMLSPVLGVLDIGFMKFSLVADHWQYFAIIGPIALCAAAIATAFQRFGTSARRGFAALVGALLIVLGVLTARQSQLYADPGTYWAAVLASDPDSWAAHNNLGGYLVAQGRSDQAREHFRRAVELRPDYATARYNLGAALAQSGQGQGQGQVDEAIVHLQRAVEINPRYVEAHNSLARALASKGQWDGAEEHLRSSLALDPAQAEAHNSLANVLRKVGRPGEAAAEYEKALALHPDFAAAQFNLGELLQQAGETHQAIARYRRALEIRPDFEPALQSLAWVLATSSDASARDGVQALALAARAEQLSGARSSVVLATLAAAYAEVGRFADAVATAERALRLATAQGRVERAERLRTQLAAYQTGTPYREPTAPPRATGAGD